MKLEVPCRGAQSNCVGALHQDRDGVVFFEYARAWCRGFCELLPDYLLNTAQGALSAPPPGLGLSYGLFQGLLHDCWGERLMRRLFEPCGIPWARVTALRKLACLGGRRIGALAFQPALDDEDFNDSILANVHRFSI